MSRKVFNPRTFDKNYVIFRDPFFGKEVTARFFKYGLPIVIIFLLISGLINWSALTNHNSGIEERINTWVNFLMFGIGVPIGLYFTLFTKRKDDRFLKDHIVSKATYRKNSTYFTEKARISKSKKGV